MAAPKGFEDVKLDSSVKVWSRTGECWVPGQVTNICEDAVLVQFDLPDRGHCRKLLSRRSQHLSGTSDETRGSLDGRAERPPLDSEVRSDASAGYQGLAKTPFNSCDSKGTFSFAQPASFSVSATGPPPPQSYSKELDPEVPLPQEALMTMRERPSGLPREALTTRMEYPNQGAASTWGGAQGGTSSTPPPMPPPACDPFPQVGLMAIRGHPNRARH